MLLLRMADDHCCFSTLLSLIIPTFRLFSSLSLSLVRYAHAILSSFLYIPLPFFYIIRGHHNGSIAEHHPGALPGSPSRCHTHVDQMDGACDQWMAVGGTLAHLMTM